MIKAIIKGIFKLVLALVNLILLPIDTLITNYLPSVANALNVVSSFFNWAASLIPWAISWFGLSSITISLFVAYSTFELTVPLLAHTVKLALQWYDKLKV